jgi:hypothetical protein
LWESQNFSKNEEKDLKLSRGASRGTRMQVNISDNFLAKGCEVVGGAGSVGLKLIAQWEYAKIMYGVR